MVIAAYNEVSIIGKKIENCLSLDYPADRIEFLVGSDGSTDGTERVVASCGDGRVKSVHFPRRRGKVVVLNELVPLAKGDIVVFSDANTIYGCGAIKSLARHFTDPRIGGVCGHLRIVNPNQGTAGLGEGLYWRYEVALKKLESRIHSTIGANGAIYAIRRELFRPLPVERALMDDFLIPLKIVELGYRVIYEPEALGQEDASYTIGDEFKRKARIGAANYNSLYYIYPLLNPAAGYVAFFLWSHKVIRWFVPLLLILAFIGNLMVVGHTPFQLFFVLQISFYLLSLVGFIVNLLGLRKLKVLSVPYYFVIVNAALLVGFIRFVTRTQRAAWERSAR
jgi:cellulose synthase/poly-beta-1,6-N-acetylglucosamine synthase-like glycosyltransferase